MKATAARAVAAIDWEQVRRRVLENAARLESALAETPERIEAAYRSRAERLAAQARDARPSSPGVASLVFRVARERYAIELSELSEVLPYTRCVRVPGAPVLFRGVIHVHGELRSVVDLGRLLVPSADGGDESGFVLMLRRPGRQVGLLVERIDELRELRAEELDVASHAGYAKSFHDRARIQVLAVDAVLDKVFSKQEPLTT